MIEFLDPYALRRQLLDGGEFALLDLRGGPALQSGHLLLAVNLPLDVISGAHGRDVVSRLVPRPTVRVILCDDDGGQAEQGAKELQDWGYENISILENGIASWEEAGFQLFQGTYTVNNAFAFFLEYHFATPRIEAEDLARKLAADENLVIIDSRPAAEHFDGAVPGALNLPLAELVYRFTDFVSDPLTEIVLHCGGKARAVLGCQALRNAAISNKVSALEHGTMGWDLSGRDLAQGRRAPDRPVTSNALDWSSQAAARMAADFSVPTIDWDQLQAWRQDPARSLYLIDVRSRPEYQAGHLPGSRWVPGGELVGLTEDHMAVRNARVCLVDDNGARATLTALYLRQMGWRDAVVLKGGISGQSLTEPEPSLPEVPPDARPQPLPEAQRPQRIKAYETTIALRRDLYEKVLRDGTLSFRPK